MNTKEQNSKNTFSNSRIEETYNDDYAKWKDWRQDFNFGTLKKTDSAYFLAELKRTKYNFPSKSKVLEIGFGNGSFLKFAKNKNWDVCGTEINKRLVIEARKCGYEAKHTDNLSGFNDNTFDLVVAFDVLEHIPQDILSNVISEIRRILKKDGFFIARFPNGDSPFGLVNQHGDVTHLTTIGSNKIYYFAAKCNMKVIFVGGQAYPLFGTSLLHFIHRMFSLPIKKIINLFINLVFFPGSSVAFCSSNLTMIYKKLI
jgi:SAM-dependent methyltransferase